MNSKDIQSVYRDSKRNRRPTSCDQCRIRKAKCNRELPCENCIKRGEKATCKYASNAIRNSAGKRRNSNVGERLRRVEKLVSELVGSEENAQATESQGGVVHESIQEERFVPRNSNTVEIEQPTPRKARGHIEDSHWLSILDDIKEVREQLAQSDIMTSPEDNADINDEAQEEEIDLVLGATQPLPTLQEIVNSLPPRPMCDMLLSQYFTSPVVLPIIHTTKFQNEYEKFWQDPSKAPPLWVGLLFSILACVAAVAQAMTPTAAETNNKPLSLPAKPLRRKTVQCLIMGNYKDANSYALETLVMYLLGTYIDKPDSSFDGWFLMGTIIRLAMRMGYHRDPTTLKSDSKITPFEGEMRRRRWHVILQLDTLMSFQMGMPSVIPPEFCDTEPPRNLKDEDIWPTMSTLPPSRPSSDYTPVLYTIAKAGVMNMFRKVLVHTHSSSSSTSPPSYPITIELDAKLRETYASIPEPLKWRPINQSFTVSSGLIINRSTIELLYLKSIIVLHRRYLNTERHDSQREFSRRACINAALEVLSRQTDLHAATSSLHGRLYEDRWMVSSLTAHDFLLASMVICLELSVLMRSLPAAGKGGKTGPPQFGRLLDALLNSQRIWASKSVYSNEARMAASTLQLMIDKVQGNISSSSYDRLESTSAHQLHNQPSHKFLHPSSTSSTPTTLPPPAEQHPQEIPTLDLPFADTMTEMITGSEDLDWALLDHYLQNTGSTLPPPNEAQVDMPYSEWAVWDADMGLDMNMDGNIGMELAGQGHGQGYYPGYFG